MTDPCPLQDASSPLSDSRNDDSNMRAFDTEDASWNVCADGVQGLGGKTIDFASSWALTVNNITGPGMLHLARVFQNAGLVPATLVFLGICASSTGAATLFCDTMARLPGNDHFGRRYEYSDAFKHYFGHRSFQASQVLFFLAIFSQTVASIVGAAQAMDGLLVLMFREAWALQPAGGDLSWFVIWSPQEYCGELAESTTCVPFTSHMDNVQSPGIIITVGYVLTLLMFAPLGKLNLDDNMKIQMASLLVLITLSAEFCSEMLFSDGLDFSNVPLFGDDYSDVIGTIMFNFAFCPTTPAWLNEKRPEVSVGKVLWSSAFASTILYLAVGIMSAMAFPHAEGNVLQTLSAGRHWLLTKISSFLFGVLVLGPGIPVFCIVMRYNLFVGRVCGARMASFLGVILPWLVSWLLYTGNYSSIFVNASGAVLVSLVAFIGPLALSLASSGVKLRGPNYMSSVCHQVWQRVELRPTCCSALPARWLHHQRRYIGVLLIVLVPAVIYSIIIEGYEILSGQELS